jgi:hypothetical protein
MFFLCEEERENGGSNQKENAAERRVFIVLAGSNQVAGAVEDVESVGIKFWRRLWRCSINLTIMRMLNLYRVCSLKSGSDYAFAFSEYA